MTTVTQPPKENPRPPLELGVFYFKATCPSIIDPCTTIAQLGTNKEEARLIAQLQFANCKIEEISQSEYNKAC
jgi:hypothetical protein